MPEAKDSMSQLARYARVARNSQILLVMEPLEPIAAVEKAARDAIAQDASDYLTEVLEGVESPYFATYFRHDTQYLDLVAADKAREPQGDRYDDVIPEPKLHMTDTGEAQAATFAYLASISCMRQIKVPFFQAPSLRASVSPPRTVGEFVDTVGKVKDATLLAREPESYHSLAMKEGWRTAFAFWEANRWLAAVGTFNSGMDVITPV